MMTLKVLLVFRCGEKRSLRIRWDGDPGEVPSITNIAVMGSSGTLLTEEGSLVQWFPSDVIYMEVTPVVTQERTAPIELLQPVDVNCEVCSYELIAEPLVVGDEIMFRGKCPQCLAPFESSCPAEYIPNYPK